MRKSVRQILQLVVGTVISVSRDKANKVANYSQVTKAINLCSPYISISSHKNAPKDMASSSAIGGKTG